MSVQFERDERKFDFHDIGLAIKRAREAKGMTQEQLACIIDRDPRTVMYNENDGQHPSLNTFYKLSLCWIFPLINSSILTNRMKKVIAASTLTGC